MHPAALPVIGIIGAGTMGAGIAQVALEAGHEVVLHDIDETAIERGRERIADGLRRRATALAVTDVDVDIEGWIADRLDRLRDVPSIEDVAQEAEWVIEAALEDLGLKQTIFRALDGTADERVGLATNTSALSVAAIGAETANPERVLGLHFLNPAQSTRVVEVVVTPGTSATIAAAATTLVEGWGKVAIRCADHPGFVVDRVSLPFTAEAVRIFESGRATVAEIDAALIAAGYPIGPLAALDLAGLDTAELAEAPPPPGQVPMSADEIVARVELAVSNEAFHALADGVATEADIDRALQLGANHPVGPIARARRVGLTETRRQLLALVATEGDRFQPAAGLGDGG